MRHSRRVPIRLLVLMMGVLGLLAAAAPHANATPDPATPIAKANPGISSEVIKSLPAWLQQRSDIRIDPSLRADVPLVFSDGTVVPGQSASKARAASSCQKTMVAPAGWDWQTITGSCGYIGLTDKETITYNVWRDTYSSGDACFQALGNKQVSTTKPPLKLNLVWVSTWYGAGCSTGNKTVLWGKVAGMPQMKVKSTLPGVGWAGGFAT